MRTDPYVLTVNGHRHEVADGWAGESLLFAVSYTHLTLPTNREV